MAVKTSKPVGRGVAYLRCSTNTVKQDTERQRIAIQDWAAANKLEVAEWFEDYGSRDQSEFRTDFQRLLTAARNREIKWIVVQALDRFGAKDAYELFGFISILRKHSVQLWVTEGNRCASEADEQTMIYLFFGGITSTKEQVDKAVRAQTSRAQLGKEGVYLGGIPPYGFDVACCDRRGSIVWRLVVEPSNSRDKIRTGGIKIDADGRETRVESLPAHDRGTYLRLDPSIRKERVETVKRIFHLYLTEAISPSRIASQLNSEGISAVPSQRWTDSMVRKLLSNPAVTGRPATGKISAAKFLELKNGQFVEPEKTDNYFVKLCRPKDQKDWTRSEVELFPPIVSEEDWARAFDRLRDLRIPRSPRSDSLYYSGLLRCGHCGTLMIGQMDKKGKPTYICATRNQQGKDNPSGCRFHRVTHDQIDPEVKSHLEKEGVDLKAIVDASKDKTSLDNLLDKRVQANRQANFLRTRIREFVESKIIRMAEEVLGRQQSAEGMVEIEKVAVLEELFSHLRIDPHLSNLTELLRKIKHRFKVNPPQPRIIFDDKGMPTINRKYSESPQPPDLPPEPPSNIPPGMRFEDWQKLHFDWLTIQEDYSRQSYTLAYDALFQQRSEQLKERLEALEAQHDELFSLFRSLKAGSRSAEKGAQELEEIERQIEETKAEMEPLSQNLESLFQDLAQLRDKVSEARVVFEKGSDRAKAEALRGAIAEIRCYFEHRAETRSDLNRVEITPKIGAPEPFYPGRRKPGKAGSNTFQGLTEDSEKSPESGGEVRSDSSDSDDSSNLTRQSKASPGKQSEILRNLLKTSVDLEVVIPVTGCAKIAQDRAKAKRNR